MTIRLTKDQFCELYPDLAEHYYFFAEPPTAGISKEEFERTYLRSKLWRLNNLYTVVNKYGEPVKFVMNYAQHVVYAASRKHPRVLILKSRQQGISTLWLISYLDDACFAPYLTVGMQAQGTDEAATLLERIKFAWERLSGDVKAFLNLRLVKDNTQEFEFSNKSKIFVRVSFRSATLQRLHVSEFGKIANAYPKRAKEVKTGTLQALRIGNTGVIESTAEGQNEFKYMWDAACLAKEQGIQTSKDFEPVFLPWFKDPDCVMDTPQPISEDAAKYFADLEAKTGYVLSDQQRWFWVAQYRELAGAIYQEYPGTPEEAFTASKDGTYWAAQFKEQGKVLHELYDPNLPVDVFFDLGVDDYMVIGFVQYWEGRVRLVREHLCQGRTIEYAMDYLANTGYRVRTAYLPHDGRQRGMTNSGHLARSVVDQARLHVAECRYGFNVLSIDRSKDLVADINAVRSLIPILDVDSGCQYIISCFLNYSKQFDDKLNMWLEIPRHDEFSHGADMVRQIAQKLLADGGLTQTVPLRRVKASGHDV